MISTLGSLHSPIMYIYVHQSIFADEEQNVHDHPDVRKAVNEATTAINSAPISISQGMYMEALTNGINMAETRRREKDPSGPKYINCIVGG